MTNLENKLRTTEEELKNNEIELVAQNEGLRGPKLRLGYLRGSFPGFMLNTGR